MTQNHESAYVTVLWGLSNGLGVIRAAFGRLNEQEMVNHLRGIKYGSGNPPYTAQVVRIFSFTGKDAAMVSFLAALSDEKHKPFAFGRVFERLANDATYATLMKSRRTLSLAKRRLNPESAYNFPDELAFLRAGQPLRQFNFWPALHRFERRVREKISAEPEVFRKAIWSSENLDRTSLDAPRRY